MSKLQITSMRHPSYRERNPDWRRWRLAYEGGRPFINAFLERFSKREDAEEFASRKKMTYCPRFAGAAVDDVKNSIYGRMTDIVRTGGDQSYQDGVAGLDGGVDLEGSNMNRFIGQLVLPELLITSKVGVYVDMPSDIGPTVADNFGKRPYLYYYCAEDIANWDCAYDGSEKYYTSLLLRDNEVEKDDEYGLASGTKKSWRLYQLTLNGVEVSFLNDKNEITSKMVLPGLRRIPFVLMELNKALMEDIADYQVALLNLESSDINYMLRANFPFYVEQYDPRTEMSYGGPNPEQVGTDPNMKKKEVVTGNTTGRRYPLHANAPAFIHPSPEPLKISMEKEDKIKQDMRKLLSLSLSYLEPKFASAQSKGMDDRSLEAGLASLGLILQHGENQIAEIWSGYLNSEAATVHYPRSYSLKSEDERRADAKSDAELMSTVPSRTYQREISKKIAHTMLSHLVSPEVMDKIIQEVDGAKYMSGLAADISMDLTSGLVTEETASEARGYADGEVAKARTQHAERLARIQKAQSPQPANPGARGNPDASPVAGNPNPDNTQRGNNNGATGK